MNIEKITAYIEEKYDPAAVIIYGSYADGSNNENSDFDALVISETHAIFHDGSLFYGVRLDVFVYPKSYFGGDIDCEDFVQIFDGKIILDTDGIGINLKNRINKYLSAKPKRSKQEIKSDIEWCRKMLERTKRRDAEGNFRRHWLLVDSLEIFCDAAGIDYHGPKKSLKAMNENFPDAFSLYFAALGKGDYAEIDEWVGYLENFDIV